MRDRMVKLVKNTPSREIRQVLREHGIDVVVDKLKKTVKVIVDKTYAMHFLMKSSKLKYILDGISKIYGAEYKTSLKVEPRDQTHDREMNIPRVVHY